MPSGFTGTMAVDNEALAEEEASVSLRHKGFVPFWPVWLCCCCRTMSLLTWLEVTSNSLQIAVRQNGYRLWGLGWPVCLHLLAGLVVEGFLLEALGLDGFFALSLPGLRACLWLPVPAKAKAWPKPA